MTAEGGGQYTWSHGPLAEATPRPVLGMCIQQARGVANHITPLALAPGVPHCDPLTRWSLLGHDGNSFEEYNETKH